MFETDVRAGLCRWYVQNVGHVPDEEPDGPRPIRQLIEDVAAHMLPRFTEPRMVLALDWLLPDTATRTQCQDRGLLVWT